MGYFGYGYGYDHPWYGIFGGLIMVIFWVLIISLIISFIRRGRIHDHKQMHGGMYGGGRAIDVLKERYAKGEIDKKEFEEKKKDLE